MAMNLGKSHTVSEGLAPNRPPLFDGTGYAYWKNHMSIFLQSDYELWDVVQDGPFVPMKEVDGKQVPKTREEMTPQDKKNIAINARAMNVLYCALNEYNFNKVQACTSAKEI